MRTERQIEASRANGAKSRGPVTPEGKRNSSANAIKHGLLAETVVLKGELEERFLEGIADIHQELQPETPIEHALVEKMAVARWRQLRLWGMEKAAMEYQIRQQAASVGRGESNATRASLAFQTLGGDSRSLDLIIRYDALCDRQYLRAHKRFLEMRRRPAVPAGVQNHPESSPEPAVCTDDIPVPESEKQSNEPGNMLKTKPALNPNPAISAEGATRLPPPGGDSRVLQSKHSQPIAMLLSIKEMEVRKIPFAEEWGPGGFDFSDSSVIQTAPLSAKGTAELLPHTGGEVRVQGRVKTDLETECDRCLGRAQFHIDAPFDLFYRPVESDVEDEVAIDEGEAEIGFYELPGLQLEDIVREQVLLQLPMQRTCKEDCLGICPSCGANRNEIKCSCQPHPGDDRPGERWMALKDLHI